MLGYVDQLSRMGIHVENEMLTLMLLTFLSDSCETSKISLTNFAPNGTLSVNYIKSRILNEEIRQRSQSLVSSPQSEVLVTKSRRKSQSRSSKRRKKSRRKSNKYTNIECHHCKKKDHIKTFAGSSRRSRRKRTTKAKEQNKMTTVMINMQVPLANSI